MAGVKRVAVVTESTASLPKALGKEFGITVVPIPFDYAGNSYLDGVDVTPGEFNRMLSPNLPLARTSAPSVGTYAETFGWLAGEGYEVLHLAPTPAVTRMYETAEQGRRLAQEGGVEKRIEVVDSGTATMAQGFLAREAARMAQEGADMDEILTRIQDLRSRVYLLVTLNTLEYLAKTSRIPNISSLFGQALRIKPIILFANGTVKPLERPRSRKKSVRRLLELVERHLHSGSGLHVAVQHAAAPADAEDLRHTLETRLKPEEILVSEFSPVMSSYTGPGLLGVAFYEDPESPLEDRG